jgi:hypothetical protein
MLDSFPFVSASETDAAESYNRFVRPPIKHK